MKKIAAILFALAVSTGAGAVSVGVNYDDLSGINVPANKASSAKQQAFTLSVSEKINDNFSANVAITSTNNNTGASTALAGSRAEVGLTGSMPLFGPVSAYTRVGLGQKFTSSNNFTYYSVEPGVAVKVPGVAGLTARAGYRFRDAVDNTNSDNSETKRFSLSYQLSPKDTVSIGYDRNASQNATKFGYSRNF
jgi:hypothetical protein